MIKKSITVFAAVLLMSSSLNAISSVDVLPTNCSDYASIEANNFLCEHYGENYTVQQYNQVYRLFYNTCAMMQ